MAEERLAYLTELYDTGRWTRYFTQAQLLENVRDARRAVDAWKLLVSTEALPNNRPVNLEWLDSTRPLPPRKPLMIHGDEARPPARPAAQPFIPTLPSMPSLRPSLASLVPPARIDFRDNLAPIKLKTPPPMPAPVAAAVAKPASITTKPAAMPAKPVTWQNSLDFALMRERYPLLRKTG